MGCVGSEVGFGVLVGNRTVRGGEKKRDLGIKKRAEREERMAVRRSAALGMELIDDDADVGLA